MDRTLILDESGNAVITCNEDFDVITILSGEIYTPNGIIPGKKFSISGVTAIEGLRDYLNSVCSKNIQYNTLKKEQSELKDTHLANPTKESTERLREINKTLLKLKGNSVHGRTRKKFI